MLSAREYDLIKCRLSQGLLDEFLTEEEKKKYSGGNEGYFIPSELLLKFLMACDQYFERVFEKLRNKKIRVKEENDKVTIIVEVTDKKRKTTAKPIKQIVEDIRIFR